MSIMRWFLGCFVGLWKLVNEVIRNHVTCSQIVTARI